MTQKFKPTNRQQQQQQQQINPAQARAEKKLNEQINKQKTTITYNNNSYQRLVIKHSKNMQTICRSEREREADLVL